jgi:hypothetical protein
LPPGHRLAAQAHQQSQLLLRHHTARGDQARRRTRLGPPGAGLSAYSLAPAGSYCMHTFLIATASRASRHPSARAPATQAVPAVRERRGLCA